MPQKTIKYPNVSLDGRVKITKEEYPHIKQAYSELQSTRKVAALFNISRRLVQFIVYPERYEKMKHEQRINQTTKKYYTTEKRREEMRKYRAKKRLLGYLVSAKSTQ